MIKEWVWQFWDVFGNRYVGAYILAIALAILTSYMLGAVG